MSEPEKKLEDIKDLLLDMITDSEAYLVSLLGHFNKKFREVGDAPPEDLPKYVNETDKAVRALVKSRLTGEPIDIFSVIEGLSDCEFDYEVYNSIGVNDGTLRTVSRILYAMGHKEEAIRASSAIYSE